jgi:hypothetical protein
MQPSTITLIVAVVGIAGTFASGVAIQYLTWRSQRRQWLLDKKTQEYRELIDALTAAYMEAMHASQLHEAGMARLQDEVSW